MSKSEFGGRVSLSIWHIYNSARVTCCVTIYRATESVASSNTTMASTRTPLTSQFIQAGTTRTPQHHTGTLTGIHQMTTTNWTRRTFQVSPTQLWHSPPRSPSRTKEKPAPVNSSSSRPLQAQGCPGTLGARRRVVRRGRRGRTLGAYKSRRGLLLDFYSYVVYANHLV